MLLTLQHKSAVFLCPKGGKEMKKIFISHPLTGDIEKNRKKVDKICRELLKNNLLPISPLHLFGFIDEETDHIRRDILIICYRLINMSDEVWIYGESEGCKLEEEYAIKTAKPVRRLF